MRSVLPTADRFRRSRLSSATIKLCPVLNYVMSRHGHVLGNSHPPAEKKKTGKKLKHVSLCTQYHNLTRKTWQNFLMNGWLTLCEQYLKTDFWPVCYRLKLVLALKTIYLMQEWCSLFFVARGHNIALSVKNIIKFSFDCISFSISLDIMSRSLLCPASTFLLV